MQVGHTHNLQDQRFATSASILAEAERLECPAEFRDLLQSKLCPPGDCVAEVVELMHASLDWKAWLAPLDVDWHGHTSSKYTKLRGQECVHCFRFMKRMHLNNVGASAVQSEFPEPPSPDDVVVLFKQNISDKNYCGVPVVCLPAGRTKLLCGDGPKVVPRHRLSDNELGHLANTADAIEKRPWAMTAAAAYLRSFVENNVKGAPCTNPPDITWFWKLSHTDIGHPTDGIDEDLDEPNARPPQRVRISGKQRGRGTGQRRGRGTKRGPGEQVVVAPAEEPMVAAPAEEQEVAQEGEDLAAVAPVGTEASEPARRRRAKGRHAPSSQICQSLKVSLWAVAAAGTHGLVAQLAVPSHASFMIWMVHVCTDRRPS